jgi:hypothetical protein
VFPLPNVKAEHLLFPCQFFFCSARLKALAFVVVPTQPFCRLQVQTRAERSRADEQAIGTMAAAVHGGELGSTAVTRTREANIFLSTAVSRSSPPYKRCGEVVLLELQVTKRGELLEWKSICL